MPGMYNRNIWMLKIEKWKTNEITMSKVFKIFPHKEMYLAVVWGQRWLKSHLRNHLKIYFTKVFKITWNNLHKFSLLNRLKIQDIWQKCYPIKWRKMISYPLIWTCHQSLLSILSSNQIGLLGVLCCGIETTLQITINAALSQIPYP